MLEDELAAADEVVAAVDAVLADEVSEELVSDELVSAAVDAVAAFLEFVFACVCLVVWWAAFGFALAVFSAVAVVVVAAAVEVAFLVVAAATAVCES